MVNEEKRISFLGFEWKKIILSIILILLFSYQIYVFYSVGNLMNKNSCEITRIQEQAADYREQNNTEMLEKLRIEFEPKYQKNNVPPTLKSVGL